jgi:hypothetical protein
MVKLIFSWYHRSVNSVNAVNSVITVHTGRKPLCPQNKLGYQTKTFHGWTEFVEKWLNLETSLALTTLKPFPS